MFAYLKSERLHPSSREMSLEISIFCTNGSRVCTKNCKEESLTDKMHDIQQFPSEPMLLIIQVIHFLKEFESSCLQENR